MANFKDLLNERVTEDVTSNPHHFTSRPNRQKVRQRVRRPQVVPQQELVPVEEGPPKFALDNEEAIQACNIWQYGLWSFQGRDTKLERLLA